MKQKVLVVTHNAVNEYDSSCIKIVSWQDGSVIEELPMYTHYLCFSKHDVDKEITESKDIFDVPALPFDVPEKLNKDEFNDIEKKLWKFNREWCKENAKANSVFPDNPYWLVYYNINVKDPSYKMWKNFTVYCEDGKCQDYKILAKAHTEVKDDNGKNWFDHIDEIDIKDFFSDLYNNGKTIYNADSFVNSLIEKCRSQYEVVNIIFA